ncbi:hypothetical protein FA15DRAFT_411933 [Coprinopsis marcescibilis]|uniref:Uncharacterized protein n=1 Tax=Coprinopsis marcescibilis TaxID=230819 RepID=A0A5C3KVY9_COPMA|nr:hypothetical protein FA15DRAFT_411933 [Coprinopsis marcescibilis]
MFLRLNSLWEGCPCFALVSSVMSRDERSRSRRPTNQDMYIYYSRIVLISSTPLTFEARRIRTYIRPHFLARGRRSLGHSFKNGGIESSVLVVDI